MLISTDNFQHLVIFYIRGLLSMLKLPYFGNVSAFNAYSLAEKIWIAFEVTYISNLAEVTFIANGQLSALITPKNDHQQITFNAYFGPILWTKSMEPALTRTYTMTCTNDTAMATALGHSNLLSMFCRK
jgi:hypothetical protein